MNLITKLLIWLTVFAFVDLAIPVPIVAILLIYVVLQKPEWFRELVKKLYGDNTL